jgi:hypothetical protein
LYAGSVISFMCVDDAATPSSPVNDRYTVTSVPSQSTFQTSSTNTFSTTNVYSGATLSGTSYTVPKN